MALHLHHYILLLLTLWTTTTQAEECTTPTHDSCFCARVCSKAGGAQQWMDMTLSRADWNKGWRMGTITYGDRSTCACVVPMPQHTPQNKVEGQCIARCINAGGVWLRGRPRRPPGWRVVTFPHEDLHCPCFVVDELDGEYGIWQEKLRGKNLR
ncbi:hypothetical protein CP533_2100 [Ophiocordyceps camponoti-saundersi (nom. inval.)]|nr:hypothetical protein CP533_2100 [Ophiocordyceps camponoti-saundersi (nom. inval.)]